MVYFVVRKLAIVCFFGVVVDFFWDVTRGVEKLAQEHRFAGKFYGGGQISCFS